MKLRTRDPPARRAAARPAAAAESVVTVEADVAEVVETPPLAQRRPPRKSVAPHALKAAAEADVAETPPLAQRRPPRKSVAPRALMAAETPTPAGLPRGGRTAPKKAPKGGVQKRKVVRPTARPRASSTRTRTRRPRTTAAAPISEEPHQMNGESEKGADYEMEVDGKDDHVVLTDLDDAIKDEKEREEKRPTTIDDLPEEVMLGVFSYFRPPQLCWKIGRVCRRWASWSVSPFLWRGKDYVLSPDPNLSSKLNNS